MQAIPPPLTPLTDVDLQLRREGFAILSATDLAGLAGARVAQFEGWRGAWDDLPVDVHLRDGGRYRRRRHGCFIIHEDQVTLAPPRPHWQPREYNALHGGFERWFEPLDPEMTQAPLWRSLLLALAGRASALRGAQPWFVEAHPFRIETVDGIGRPTPEGAHRDGVDLVAVILVARRAIVGGETRVFEADGPRGCRFLLDEAWSVLLLDDERVVHETTPIQPLREQAAGGDGYRDTLVLTFRANDFSRSAGSSTAGVSPAT